MLTVLQGDALTMLKTLPSESIHCCITSPPYWGLRDYKVDGQLGLEATPQEYIAKMVEVFREVKRVLRKDGTLWLNMGDGYASGDRSTYRSGVSNNKGQQIQDDMPRPKTPPGLKPKDLIGLPWMLAFALQDDGWWLRSEIIWAKPNPMPESVTDRPTKAHEQIFLLAKSAKYFYDQEGVREKVGIPTRRQKTFRGGCYTNNTAFNNSFDYSGHEPYSDGEANLSGRNLRSVWSFATQPFPEAHFATFPEELAKRCILAGTSPRGCCPKCGGPWVRIVETKPGISQACPKEQSSHEARGGVGEHTGTVGKSGSGRTNGYSTTLGFRPSCKCTPSDGESGKRELVPHGPNSDIGFWAWAPIPCTVLDPFAGSGTTGAVALKLGRKAILIELKKEYCQMIEKRCKVNVGLPL